MTDSFILEKAYAKINLFLDIEGKRDDGYHNIRTLFQNISLYDSVKIHVTPEIGDTVIVDDCDFLAPGEKSLTVKAAEVFFNAYYEKKANAPKYRVHIHVDKRIPIAAGLAGGSADAAAVLRGLNQALDCPFSAEELSGIGVKIGADVPFCLLGGCAEAKGIGDEIVERRGLSRNAFLVVACGSDRVSTPEAYGWLDERFDSFRDYSWKEETLKRLLASLEDRQSELQYDCFYNIFEEVVPDRSPMVERIRYVMQNNGADFCMMSGSGPSVFGLFPSKEKSDEAAHILSVLGVQAFVCNPLA